MEYRIIYPESGGKGVKNNKKTQEKRSKRPHKRVYKKRCVLCNEH